MPHWPPSVPGLIPEVGGYLGYGPGPYSRGQLDEIQAIIGRAYEEAKAFPWPSSLVPHFWRFLTHPLPEAPDGPR